MVNDSQDSHARVVKSIRMGRALQEQANKDRSLEVTQATAVLAAMHYVAAMAELFVSNHPQFDGEL